MYSKLGTVGDRTSGFEKGKSRRGRYGRGAKDVAVFGCTHFESIKDGKYSYLTINPLLDLPPIVVPLFKLEPPIV